MKDLSVKNNPNRLTDMHKGIHHLLSRAPILKNPKADKLFPKYKLIRKHFMYSNVLQAHYLAQKVDMKHEQALHSAPLGQ